MDVIHLYEDEKTPRLLKYTLWREEAHWVGSSLWPNSDIKSSKREEGKGSGKI